jgi:hypothetical protein
MPPGSPFEISEDVARRRMERGSLAHRDKHDDRRAGRGLVHAGRAGARAAPRRVGTDAVRGLSAIGRQGETGHEETRTRRR